jgi:murein DD-endopeptidase MepM/ murein hydrolase activator NlpD
MQRGLSARWVLPIIWVDMLSGHSIRLIFVTLLGFVVANQVLGAARFAHQPDFDDFRKRGKVISGYSSRPEHRHYGVTLRVRESTVRALADGRVHSAGYLRGYGQLVIVDHGQGWHSLYSNLGRITVKKGQRVSRGDALAHARNKRLFLVVSYRGNPINPSDLS